MTDPAILAAVAIPLPLLLGVAAFTPRMNRFVAVVGPWAALPALALAVVSTRSWAVDVPWLWEGARIGVDHVGWVFLVLAALTWLFASISAGEGGAFFFLSMTGCIGVTLARDAVTFFVCGALMSLSAYGLVTRSGNPQARRAGRAYLAFTILGEALLVSGLAVAVWSAGTTNLDDLPSRMVSSRSLLPATTLILLGCGIKVGAVPLHAWLPVSYAAASTAAATALSGTVSKVGVLAVLRFLPLGYLSLTLWGVSAALLGVLATMYGVVMGVPQRDPKTVLAYSTISEMGSITTAIGMGLVVASAWPALLAAILVYVLHHGLTKGALFLSVGARQTAIGGPVVETVAVVAIVWLGLSLAGAPLTSGAEAKMVLKSAIAGTGIPAATGIVSMLSLGAAGTTVLVARLVWLLMSVGGAGPSSRTPSPRLSSLRRAGWELREYRMAVAWIAAVASAVLLPWTLLARLTSPSNTLSMSSVGYIAAGVGTAVAVAWAARRGLWRWSLSVPPGDVLIPLERAAGAVWAVLGVASSPGKRDDAHVAGDKDRDTPPSRRD